MPTPDARTLPTWSQYWWMHRRIAGHPWAPLRPLDLRTTPWWVVYWDIMPTPRRPSPPWVNPATLPTWVTEWAVPPRPMNCQRDRFAHMRAAWRKRNAMHARRIELTAARRRQLAEDRATARHLTGGTEVSWRRGGEWRS